MRLALWLLLASLTGLGGSCPPPCDCKWKSGKESAICARGNLSGVPSGLDPSLQLIDLSGNPISTVGMDAFSSSGLLNLQRIYLAGCRLKSLNKFAFRRLSNLVELDLSNNSLSSVPSHIFDSIPELRELKLSGNPIQKVASEAFSRVPQLVKLELSECRLAVIETKAFSGLEASLHWLKLDGNRLVAVRPLTLLGLRSLKGLELAGNPWNCSCLLRPLKIWLSSRRIPSSAVCSSPPRLTGKPWDKLEESDFACRPSIQAGPGVEAVEGTNVTMSCSVGGIPVPSVQWIWKNRPLSNGSALPSHRKVYILQVNGTRSSLTIFSAELVDAGVYFCVASNRAGRVEGNVTLAVTRRKPEGRLTVKVLGIGAAVALVFFLISSTLFCFVGQGRKETRSNQTENYEKIEMDKKNDICFSELQSNKVHPTMGEYRGIPSSAEEVEEETCSSSVQIKTGYAIPRENSLAGGVGGGLGRPELAQLGLQQHILRKEVLPTTSLYTTAAPDDSRNYPDLLTTPPATASSHPLPVSASATLPRSKNWYSKGSSSQSPLLAESRCDSSTGESSISWAGRRYSIESRSSSYYPRSGTGVAGGGRSGRCERSASSLDLFDPEPSSWHHPSLPSSPVRRHPHRDVTETPILDCLGSAVYDLHAAQLERFLEEYRSLQEELERMKETCDGLRVQPSSSPLSSPAPPQQDYFSLYTDVYRGGS